MLNNSTVSLLAARPELLAGTVQRDEDIATLEARYPGASHCPIVHAIRVLPLAESAWSVRLPLWGYEDVKINITGLLARHIADELDTLFPGPQLWKKRMIPITSDVTGGGDCTWIDLECTPQTMLYRYYHDTCDPEYAPIPESRTKFVSLHDVIY